MTIKGSRSKKHRSIDVTICLLICNRLSIPSVLASAHIIIVIVYAVALLSCAL